MRTSSPPQGIVKTQLGRVVNKKDRASGLGVARSDVLVYLICNFAKYSNVGLGSSLRGEPGLTTFRSQGCT